MHSVGESVRGMTHTNGIESFRVLLNRGWHRPLNERGNNLWRDVNEFAGRCNTTGQSTMSKVEQRVVAVVMGRCLTHRQLIC